MKNKTLWSVSISTTPLAEDAVGELLSNYFSQPAAAYTNIETGVAIITVYVPKKPDWKLAEKALTNGLRHIQSCGLSIGSGNLDLQKVARENWAESWKRHFHPIEVGGSLLVKPSWSRQKAKKKQAVVILDPGLSFGTGQHPTTGFCLRQLVELSARPKSASTNRPAKVSLLDIGTGSGILAIAAAKVGCTPVEAFDFDPDAVAVARTNARRNRVTEKIRILQADVTRLPLRAKRQFSIVCANLISNLLISEQRRIIATVKPGGALILAGILQTEFAQVQTAYESAGLRLLTAFAENEWKSGVFVRGEA
ncbi:MAG: 50S ribosomal protein L11 methyltransferase [Verrucomicrobiota bacterium]